jgi:NAD(P)H dehydrogenase (quinone)
MRIFVVLAHPKADSFNAALCTALCDGLHDAGHEADVADLYAEGFDPVLRGPELAPPGFNRLPREVAAYQQRILRAHALAFLHPVWWFGTPAMLKGFVDRVFREDFAFHFTASGRVRGLLHHEKALVICTTGVTESLYRLYHFGRPLEKAFDAWTLKNCGIRRVQRVLLHDVVNADQTTRAGYLHHVRQLGRKYF